MGLVNVKVNKSIWKGENERKKVTDKKGENKFRVKPYNFDNIQTVLLINVRT